MTWERVSPEEIPEELRRGNSPSEISLALVNGDYVFIPGAGRGQASTYTQANGYLARHGFKAHTRQAERNGVKGLYVWAEKLTNGT